MDTTTWDGLPVAPEAPFGVAVVVSRRGGDGREFLLLHRAHHGPAYEGAWAWTPPSGARLPGETPDACAKRELREETGLDVDCRRVVETGDWLVYVAEAAAEARVVLDAEHDRYAWLSLDEAVEKCLPIFVADGLRAAARFTP